MWSHHIRLRIAFIMGTAVIGISPAQAESSLNLYGTVDIGIAWDKASAGSRKFGLHDNGQQDTMLGLQGRETLNDGNYVRFQLESDVALSTGEQEESGRLFNYQSWVGIGNEQFGEFRFGRQQSAGQLLVSELEVASWESYGMGALLRGTDNYRVSNQLSWYSPEWQGLQLGTSYSFNVDESNTNHKRVHQYSVGLSYETGPWLLAASYDTLNSMTSTSTIGERKHRPHLWQLGASYNFDFARISAAWSRQKNGFVSLNSGESENFMHNQIDGLGPIEFVQGGRLDAYYLGAGIPLAKGELQLQWSLAKPNWRWNDNNNKAGHIQVMSIGYIHPLSKRTHVYAFTAGSKRYSLEDVTSAEAPKHTQRIMLGITHHF